MGVSRVEFDDGGQHWSDAATLLFRNAPGILRTYRRMVVGGFAMGKALLGGIVAASLMAPTLSYGQPLIKEYLKSDPDTQMGNTELYAAIGVVAVGFAIFGLPTTAQVGYLVVGGAAGLLVDNWYKNRQGHSRL